MKGIGPELAARIVQRFGTATFEVLDTRPDRLAEVEGIGRVRVARIREAWKRQRDIREVMVFLQGHGITPALAVRIWKRYGARSQAVLRENPYVLAEEVAGIAFPTADAIARKLGVAEDAPERLEAAALHALSAAADEGHVWQPRGSLAAACARLTGAGEGACREADRRARRPRGRRARGRPRRDRSRPCPGSRRPSRPRRPSSPGSRGHAPLPAPWTRVHPSRPSRGPRASPCPRGSARRCRPRARAGLLVITGGPGTGKTTLVRAIVDALQRGGLRVLLCAPTGRAAKRLAEATGREAKTIHRLLEYSAGGFKRNAGSPLEGDAVIVDETSMVDIELFHCLLQALPADGRLVLVGDRDQLPSVGPGAVLADLIASGVGAGGPARRDLPAGAGQRHRGGRARGERGQGARPSPPTRRAISSSWSATSPSVPWTPSWISWRTASPGSSGSIPGATCRCSCRCSAACSAWATSTAGCRSCSPRQALRSSAAASRSGPATG